MAQIYRQEKLGRVMDLLHTHALRCLDDADERVRVAACSACCRLLSRAAIDARSCRPKPGEASQNQAGGVNVASGAGDDGLGVSVGERLLAHAHKDVSSSGGGGSQGMSGIFSSSMSFGGEMHGDASSVAPGSRGGGTSSGNPGASGPPGSSLGGIDSSSGATGLGDSGLGGRRAKTRLSWSGDRAGWLSRDPSFWGEVSVRGMRGEGIAAWVRTACLEVLERLLTVGLSDEAGCVRQEVVVGLEVSGDTTR